MEKPVSLTVCVLSMWKAETGTPQATVVLSLLNAATL